MDAVYSCESLQLKRKIRNDTSTDQFLWIACFASDGTGQTPDIGWYETKGETLESRRLFRRIVIPQESDAMQARVVHDLGHFVFTVID